VQQQGTMKLCNVPLLLVGTAKTICLSCHASEMSFFARIVACLL